jgi:hypothetical protein
MDTITGSNPVLTTNSEIMVIVKVKNCKYQGRKNQNTTFLFSQRDYGFLKDEIVTLEWVLENLNTIKKDIEKQHNTTIKIEQR